MTNAARRADAARIDVLLDIRDDGGLRVEVRDDGTTPRSACPAGVGLTSMRERAAKLSGSCNAGPVPGGGGKVVAVLPLHAAIDGAPA
jgi:signal transduction histidine kinase